MSYDDHIDLYVEQFAGLFAGRTDAVGTEAGGSVRGDSLPWEELWHNHLTGREPIGIYPLRADGRCRWGCIDLDIRSDKKPSGDYANEDDANTVARNLQNVWSAVGIRSWIERTRSHGRHVWIFTDDWIDATVMRHAQLAVCQIAGASAREVNPKQTCLADGQLGNYVRLPYVGEQRPMIRGHDHSRYRLAEFLHSATHSLASETELAAVADLWQPPAQPTVVVDSDLAVQFRNAAGRVPPSIWFRMNPKARAVFAHGPSDGDRSDGLVYLAGQCRLSGLNPAETVVVLREAGWNKFAGRADEGRRLSEVVSAAWR